MTKKIAIPGRPEFPFRPHKDLALAKRAFEHGNRFGLREAVAIYVWLGERFPQWVIDGLNDALVFYEANGKPFAQDDDPLSKHPTTTKHFMCYLAVQLAREEGRTGDSALVWATVLLAKSGLNYSMATIEDTHKNVRAELKTTAGQARYRHCVASLREIKSIPIRAGNGEYTEDEGQQKE